VAGRESGNSLISLHFPFVNQVKTMHEFSGWDPELEDRDGLRATATDLLTPVRGLFSAPKSIDPRGVLKVEDQGDQGACRGHALSTNLELIHYYASGQMVQLSRAFAYYGTQAIDRISGDRGSTIMGGVKLAKKYGLPPEPEWHYPPNYKPVPPKPWEDLYRAAEPFRIRQHAMINSYDDAYTFLGSGLGGIDLGIIWNSYCSSSGIISKYQETRGGGHAVCIVGYDPDGLLIFANSWRKSWGRSGYGLIYPEAFNAMCRGVYTVAVGLSDMATPQPRLIDWSGVNNPMAV
jgi:hypothetical protein